VHKKLIESHQIEQFRAEIEEECEDSQGTVMNRKTHEDLRRQGIL
jgi:splicing factor 3A subunit 3